LREEIDENLGFKFNYVVICGEYQRFFSIGNDQLLVYSKFSISTLKAVPKLYLYFQKSTQRQF
jgi:hypothetical protein